MSRSRHLYDLHVPENSLHVEAFGRRDNRRCLLLHYFSLCRSYLRGSFESFDGFFLAKTVLRSCSVKLHCFQYQLIGQRDSKPGDGLEDCAFYEGQRCYYNLSLNRPAIRIHPTCRIHVSRAIGYISDSNFHLTRRWKQKLSEKRRMAMITKKTNEILVHNILPVHVAELYLSRQFRNDFYNEEYESVAVMFATVVNFEAQFISTESQDMKLRILNQVICAFDETLLTFAGYLKIEKIKVAGVSYMCACGLDPGRGDSITSHKGLIDGRRSLNMLAQTSKSVTPRGHKISLRQSNNVVIVMVEFALELMRALKEICETNDNFKDQPPLKLRVGISHGKVMAGVVGLSKPLYDIWGNSVNMASRMDSTGIPGMIQVI